MIVHLVHSDHCFTLGYTVLSLFDWRLAAYIRVLSSIISCNIQVMHNPSIRSTRQHRNDFVVLSTMLLAKQPLQAVRDRQRHDFSKQAKAAKEKYSSKIQEITQQLHCLKVDGREINSIITGDTRPKRNRVTLPNKYIISEHLPHPPKAKRTVDVQAISSYTRSYPNIFADETAEDRIEESEQRNQLPEISSHKEINGHHYSSLKKEQVGKALDRSVPGKPLPSKRRETLDAKVTEQVGKGKMEAKKSSNYAQYKEFLMTVSLSNQLLIQPEEEGLYRAFICKGNNGLLVRSILKNRPWWSFKAAADIDSCNLVWTEWKRNKSINILIMRPHKAVRQGSEQPIFEPKSGNKEIREKGQHKFNNFAKLVGKNKQIYAKFDESILSQNYLISGKKNEDPLKDLQYQVLPKDPQRRMANHVPGCLFLHSKKLLFLSMSNYYKKLQRDVFEVIPLTFLISKGATDPEFQRFSARFEELAAKGKGSKMNNVWICKPGENSNRGNGIEVVSSISEVRALLSRCGKGRTLIVQKYMQSPFLYNKRKFDLRCYILITCVNGLVKGYWYQQGYVRTASKEYTLKNLQNKLVHLTNDAVQKKGEEYGKFENFNKVSFAELQRYIQATTEISFATVYARIKTIATDLIVSVARKINPQHRQFTFEIFGLDFMLDDRLNPYLIEANSNPCLEVDGNVLGKVIPPMVENAIRVAIDPLFPPPNTQARNRFSPGSSFESNKMALVYDSLYDLPRDEESGDLGDAQRECEQFQGENDQ